MSEGKPTTGVPEVDRLIGGVLPGDNLVWKVDSAAPVDRFLLSFLSACEAQKSPVVYVSFNRSPQTVASAYADLMSPGRFTLVDCFTSGKGENDEVFLDFFLSGDRAPCRAVHSEDPADPQKLQDQLTAIASETGSSGRYVFDSLTGMLDLWGEEDVVLRFFGHVCPRREPRIPAKSNPAVPRPRSARRDDPPGDRCSSRSSPARPPLRRAVAQKN